MCAVFWWLQVAVKNDEQGVMYFETVVPQEVLG